MCKKGTIIALSFFFTLAAISIAFAQIPSGDIKGVIKDETGAVLPGVLISASSPALLGGARTAVSGPRGGYRVSALPTGTYEVKFEMESFKTIIRQEIVVSLSVSTTINVIMELAPIAETITVTGESPLLDIKSTNIGVTFDKDLLSKIPNARDIWVVLEEAPGMVMDRFNVGGSTSGQQSRFSSGTGASQNAYNFDGIDITDMAATGAATYFPYDAFQEVQVSTLAHKAEVHTPGVFLNMVTKSGSNDFHGAYHLYYENKRLQGDNITPELEEAGVGMGNPLDYYLDFSLSLGGRVIKDKLWFYTMYAEQRIHKYALGFFYPDGTQGQDNTDLKHFIVKLDWQITDKDKISFNEFRSEKYRPLREAYTYRYSEPAAQWKQQSIKHIPQVHWTRIQSDRLMFDVSFGIMDMDFPLAPTDDSPFTQCLYDSRSGPFPANTPIPNWRRGYFNSYYRYEKYFRNRWQNNNTAAYYVDEWMGGSHDFKFGFNVFDFHSHTYEYSVNGTRLDYRDAVPYRVRFENHPQDFHYSLRSYGFYAQDTWTIGERLVINLGVRWDAWECYNPEQYTEATPWYDFFAANWPELAPQYGVRQYDEIRNVMNFSKIVPRLGFVYDLSGDGKTAIKGNWSRYGHQIGNWISNWANPNGYHYMYWRWYDRNGDLMFTTNELSSSGPYSIYSSAANQVDPDLRNPYTDEFSFSLEHELKENLAISTTFVYRKDKDLVEDVAAGVPYDGYDRVDFTVDGVSFYAYERWEEYEGATAYWYMTNPDELNGKPFVNIYKAFIIRLNKRWSDNWHMLASYTWSDAKGHWRDDDTADAATGLMDTPNDDIFSWGELYWDRPHLIKIAGSYQFPYGINFGAFFRFQSGQPYARTIETPRRLNQGYEVVPVEPRGSQRYDSVTTLDIRASKAFKIGKGNLEIMFDAFNVFNANTTTDIGAEIGVTLLIPEEILGPRIARLGVKFIF